MVNNCLSQFRNILQFALVCQYKTNPVLHFFYFILFFFDVHFLIFFHRLFILGTERETEHERERGRERGRHRIRNRLQAPSHQPRADAGLELTDHEIVTWLKSDA